MPSIDLDRLGGLERCRARRAARRARRPRRSRHQRRSRIAGTGSGSRAAARQIGHGLALEAMDRGRRRARAAEHAGVVDEVARREVVAAVDDDVVAGEIACVGGGQPRRRGRDADAGIQLRRAGARGARLRLRRSRRWRSSTWRCRFDSVDAVAVDDARSCRRPARRGTARPASRARPRRPSARARPSAAPGPARRNSASMRWRL